MPPTTPLSQVITLWVHKAFASLRKTIPELKPITDFLKRNEGNYSKEEKCLSLHVNKNARSFQVECIIFQDLSFEISINDVTQ